MYQNELEMCNQVRDFHRGVQKFIVKIQVTFPNCADTAICVQAQTANIFARLFTFETGRLPLETEMFHRSCDVSH